MYVYTYIYIYIFLARSVAPGRCIFVVAGFARLRRRSAACPGASVRNKNQ